MSIVTKSVEQIAEADPDQWFWLEDLLERENDDLEAPTAHLRELLASPAWAALKEVADAHDRQLTDAFVAGTDENLDRISGIATGLRRVLAIPGAVVTAYDILTNEGQGSEEDDS